MMTRNKHIAICIIIFMLFISLIAGENKNDGEAQNDAPLKKIDGFESITYRGNRSKHSRLNSNSLSSDKYIKTLFDENEVEYSTVNLKLLSKGLYNCISEICKYTIEKLKTCPEMMKHNGENTLRKLLTNMVNSPIPLDFVPPRDIPGAAAAYKESFNRTYAQNHYLHDMVRYYLNKMKEGKSKIDDIMAYKTSESASWPVFDYFSSYLGHEMIHAYAEMATSVYDPRDGRNGFEKIKSERYECQVHCLQRKCWGEKSKYISMPTNCDGKGLDEFVDDEGTCDFRYCRKYFKSPKPKSSRNMFSTSTLTDRCYALSSYRPDTPDDNYSYSINTQELTLSRASHNSMSNNVNSDFYSYSINPDVLVYMKNNSNDILSLFDNESVSFYPITDYTHFSNNSKVLIIPSGYFLGDENSLLLKNAIKRFIASGGTIIVLAQQYDTHVTNLVPIPDGQTLKTYGWRQDQSCINGSVYFDSMHPVVSSASNELLSVAVDGYFSEYPDNTTVLFRRTKNNEAAAISYPYGQGTVILTSLYTDWGHAHSQASETELRVFRDLLTYARNPRLPIPMYNLDIDTNPEIKVTVKVKNNTETPAAMVKISAYSPDNDLVLFETEENISLAMGQETELPVTFNLLGGVAPQRGINHVYYELYDNAGNMVHPELSYS